MFVSLCIAGFLFFFAVYLSGWQEFERLCFQSSRRTIWRRVLLLFFEIGCFTLLYQKTDTLRIAGFLGFTLWWCMAVLAFRRIGPLVTILAGTASNLVVCLANGGRMPAILLRQELVRHTPLTESSHFSWLADVFLEQSLFDPTYFYRYSIGDILITIGVWWISAYVLLYREQNPSS